MDFAIIFSVELLCTLLAFISIYGRVKEEIQELKYVLSYFRRKSDRTKYKNGNEQYLMKKKGYKDLARLGSNTGTDDQYYSEDESETTERISDNIRSNTLNKNKKSSKKKTS